MNEALQVILFLELWGQKDPNGQQFPAHGQPERKAATLFLG